MSRPSSEASSSSSLIGEFDDVNINNSNNINHVITIQNSEQRGFGQQYKKEIEIFSRPQSSASSASQISISSHVSQASINSLSSNTSLPFSGNIFGSQNVMDLGSQTCFDGNSQNMETEDETTPKTAGIDFNRDNMLSIRDTAQLGSEGK
jgi:hypothetical protein